jgi:hypothetical protein
MFPLRGERTTKTFSYIWIVFSSSHIVSKYLVDSLVNSGKKGGRHGQQSSLPPPVQGLDGLH